MSEGKPNGANDLRKAIQSDAVLTETLVGVTEAAQAEVIICSIIVCLIWSHNSKNVLG